MSPFSFSRFRAFYLVQSVSLIGNWMQELAKSYIVIALTGKASAVGALLFANAIPNLLLASFGGVMADRREIREILLVTQIALAILAFALGMVVFTGGVQFWQLVVFAVLEGVVVAFDLPAFNKITPTLVPREHFQKALALNSVNFHLSRVIGPSLAGLIMGVSGPSAVFIINAVSFLGIVFIIGKVLPKGGSEAATPLNTPRPRMREALKYVHETPLLRRIFLQLLLIIGVVFPLMFTTFRIYIQSRFHLDAREFGIVFAFPGLGALLGSFTFLIWNPKNPIKALPLGSVGIVICLGLIAESATLVGTVLSLVGYSYFMYLSLSSLTVTLHIRIENSIRGRVSALIGVLFASIAPLMGGPVGLLSDLVGPRALIWGIALTFAVISLLFPLRQNLLSPDQTPSIKKA